MVMKTRRDYYPLEWDEMRAEAFARVGYCCEECGVQDCAVVVNPNKKHPLFPDGQPYMVHLNLAHKREYETWNREAETLVLCNACHGRFDARNRRKDKGKKNTPIGFVSVRVLHRGRWVSAAALWSYNELYRAVSALPVGTKFELSFEMAMQSVGLGCYLKQGEGVEVVREKGVGRQFGLVLAGIPSYV
ncbi:MAG TPA: hypothetical protein VFV38_34200 [Ktedonobacteraceae bacterium]|nr:hypothetical protein [Ktedonobacteraceae bacterium]